MPYECKAEHRFIDEMYRGRQTSFPIRLYNRDKVAEQIVEEYDGHNLAELTKKI